MTAEVQRVAPRQAHWAAAEQVRKVITASGVGFETIYGEHDNVSFRFTSGAVCPVRTVAVPDGWRVYDGNGLSRRVRETARSDNGSFVIGVERNTREVYAVRQATVVVNTELPDGFVVARQTRVVLAAYPLRLILEEMGKEPVIAAKEHPLT